MRRYSYHRYYHNHRRISLFCISFLLALTVMMSTRSLFSSSSKSKGIGGAAMALSTSTTTTVPKQYRILCFGDSLTAGTTFESYQEYPYAPHLEKALKENNMATTSTSTSLDIMVRHKGYPGWTADQLLESASGPGGLRSIIQNVQNPSLSLVVLLAGTNDLGYMRSPQEIVESLIGLHKLCLQDEGIPNTIAIGIPSSAYQSINDDAKTAAHTTNELLKTWCENESNGKSTYFPFPFDFERNSEKLWSSDGLHFSPKGYEILGQSLVPLIQKLIVDSQQ